MIRARKLGWTLSAFTLGLLAACSGDDTSPSGATPGNDAAASNDGTTGTPFPSGDGGEDATSDTGEPAADAEVDGAVDATADATRDATTDAASADAANDAADAASTDAGADAHDAGPVGLVLPPHGVCTTTHWCERWPAPFFHELSGVWGSSENDVWVAGRSDLYLYWMTTLAHWDGVEWRGVVTDGKLATALGGSAKDDVWSVGPAGSILHFDGISWQPVSSGTSMELTAVWAASKTQAWAVGRAGTLRVWNGATWGPMSSGTADDLTSVWGSGPSDLWIAGASGVRHWNGNAWTPMAPAPIVSLWGASPTEVYGVTSASPYTLYKANGTSWSSLGQRSSPLANAGTPVIYGTGSNQVLVAHSAFTGTYDGTFNGFQTGLAPMKPLQLWASAPTNAYAVGGTEANHVAPLARWNGTAWASVTGTPLANTQVSAYAYVAPTDIWAAAGATMRHYDGATYTSYPTGTATAMTTVDAAGSKDVWAGGGGNGVVSHWNGTSWSAEAVGFPQVITAFRSFGPNDVWAIGNGGGVYHRDANGWSDRSPGGESGALVIDGTSTNDVWVVGSAIHHWTGSWSTTALPASYGTPLSVHAFATNDVVIGGTDLLRYDGVQWKKYATGTGIAMNRWLWLAPNDAWASSAYNVVHFDGVSWTIMESGIEGGNIGVLGAKGDVWVGGAAGELAHYDP